MKFFRKIILGAFLMSLFTSTNVAMAGDCTKRNIVDWQGTISSAVYVRVDCPSGDIIGTVPAGESVSIKEVDLHGDFYLIETSVGTGFVYKTYLKDIDETPLLVEVQETEPVRYENSLFWDLDPEHQYYDYIVDVQSKGIVNGNPDGSIEADKAINRAALAKILVEATNNNDTIAAASLEAGVYSDVKIGSWYAPYLKIARDMGVMTGDKGKNTVRPSDDANGAEVAKMVAEAFGINADQAREGEEWYEPYFRILGMNNALPYSEGSHKVTRAEMMFMISSLLNQNGHDGGL